VTDENTATGAGSADETQPRVLRTFLEAVRVDSPSGEEAVFARWCEERLAALGCWPRYDDSAEATGSDTGNLIAELPGTGPGLTIVLSGHLDTVEPGRGIEPVVEDGIVRSSGKTILASDDKAGIAAIIEALTRLVESGEDRAPIRVLLTTGEEQGLQGAKALEAADCFGDLCLVLDAHGAVGGIVTDAPTQYTFRARFTGLASHAGVEPEKGRSAIAMAARAISSMRLGRLDPETTANIGRIEGGTATNVVAAECRMTGECRSVNRAKVEALRQEMDAILHAAAKDAGGEVSVTWTLEYEGYRFVEGDPLLTLVEDACRDAGVTPQRFATGGGSDGNVLVGKGLPTLVLSCGMENVHSTAEYVAVADLEAMAELLLAVLARATRA
jgi:tripeptide aminopeptidase